MNHKARTLVRIIALASLVVGIVAGCKTGGEGPGFSEVLDFDDDADPSLINLEREYEFCSDSTSFNVVNAYWLGIASTYVYAKKAIVNEVIDDIREKWKAKVEFFSNDTDVATEHHTQAMWIEFSDFAILSFRGTQTTLQDFATDGRFFSTPFSSDPQYGNVHLGFRDGMDVIWSDVKAKIQTLKGTRKPLFLTGHSLGGALATLAAARILLQPEFADVAKNNLSGLYTYGGPRLGDEKFAQAVRAKAMMHPSFHMARFRNHADVVTRVPSSRLVVGYEHIGPLYYFDEPGRLYSSTSNVNLRRLFMPHDVKANMIENFADYMGRQFVTKYSDHSMFKYLDKIDAEYKLHTAWIRKNNKSLCDMGMFAVPWEQSPSPPEIKPYTNDLPIAAARTEAARRVKDCCWCYRTWYYSQWGTDSRFKQENWVGVIQEGEIASGNCMYPGGKPQGHMWWQGQTQAPNGSTYDQYYRYSACEGVTLVGDSCVAGAEIFKEGRPTGTVIRTDSWVP